MLCAVMTFSIRNARRLSQGKNLCHSVKLVKRDSSSLRPVLSLESPNSFSMALRSPERISRSVTYDIFSPYSACSESIGNCSNCLRAARIRSGVWPGRAAQPTSLA